VSTTRQPFVGLHDRPRKRNDQDIDSFSFNFRNLESHQLQKPFATNCCCRCVTPIHEMGRGRRKGTKGRESRMTADADEGGGGKGDSGGGGSRKPGRGLEAAVFKERNDTQFTSPSTPAFLRPPLSFKLSLLLLSNSSHALVCGHIEVCCELSLWLSTLR